MAENKTKVTSADPANYIAAIDDQSRREDCETLMRLMAKVTTHPAKMWGTAIVGFGTDKYPLSGGRLGEICAVGFSSRKDAISIYGVAGEATDSTLLATLGKYKLGKGCLYIARLSDIDTTVLEQLIANAIKAKPYSDDASMGAQET
ncbi:MAG: DUF1801 domain-containing protein [Thermoguttaceae bacterium]